MKHPDEPQPTPEWIPQSRTNPFLTPEPEHVDLDMPDCWLGEN